MARKERRERELMVLPLQTSSVSTVPQSLDMAAMALWQPPSGMTLDELRALVESVDLSHAPFKMWFTVQSWTPGTYGDGRPSLNVMLSWQVPERDDAKRLVTINHWVHLRPGMKRQIATDIISGAVKEAFNHEFAECFKIGGVRIHDPHPRPPTLSPETLQEVTEKLERLSLLYGRRSL